MENMTITAMIKRRSWEMAFGYHLTEEIIFERPEDVLEIIISGDKHKMHELRIYACDAYARLDNDDLAHSIEEMQSALFDDLVKTVDIALSGRSNANTRPDRITEIDMQIEALQQERAALTGETFSSALG